MGNYESDYEEYERQCELRQQENVRFLNWFEESLESAKLKPQTIRRHLGNVDFYLNVFLLREKPLNMEQGCFKADRFFGDFFIRKCMWSTPSSIKSNAASLKKFYKCMLEHGAIEQESYDYFIESIREGMEYWTEDCEQYNSGGLNPFW